MIELIDLCEKEYDVTIESSLDSNEYFDSLLCMKDFDSEYELSLSLTESDIKNLTTNCNRILNVIEEL